MMMIGLWKLSFIRVNLSIFNIKMSFHPHKKTIKQQHILRFGDWVPQRHNLFVHFFTYLFTHYTNPISMPFSHYLFTKMCIHIVKIPLKREFCIIFFHILYDLAIFDIFFKIQFCLSLCIFITLIPWWFYGVVKSQQIYAIFICCNMQTLLENKWVNLCFILFKSMAFLVWELFMNIKRTLKYLI